MRAIIVVTAAAIAAALGATGAFATQTRTNSGIFGCTHDVTVNGHFEIKFCGPATALVHVGTHTGNLKGGSCVTSTRRFALNLGISTTALKNPPNWLSVTTLTQPRAGKQNASISLVLGGTNYAILNGTVTLKPGLRRGSINGLTGPTPVLTQNVKVTGTFTC